jgi:hypothetical protein
MNEQDRKRKRALVVLQVVIYGYLLTMFLIQLYMRTQRNW